MIPNQLEAITPDDVDGEHVLTRTDASGDDRVYHLPSQDDPMDTIDSCTTTKENYELKVRPRSKVDDDERWRLCLWCSGDAAERRDTVERTDLMLLAANPDDWPADADADADANSTDERVASDDRFKSDRRVPMSMGRQPQQKTTFGPDDLTMSDTTYRPGGYNATTRHFFVDDDDTALCGNHATAKHDRVDAPDDPTNTVACDNCKISLIGVTSDYASDDEIWNLLGDLDESEIIRITFADGDGETVEAVVTKPHELGEFILGTRSVQVTTQPDRSRGMRDDGATPHLLRREGDDTVEMSTIFDENEREIESIETTGETYDWYAGEDAETREKVIHATEQMAAQSKRKSERLSDEGDGIGAAYHGGRGQVLSDTAYLLRGSSPRRRPDPLAYARQNSESKADGEKMSDAPRENADCSVGDATHDGRIDAHREILDLLDTYQSAQDGADVDAGDDETQTTSAGADDDSDRDSDDADDGRLVTDGGRDQDSSTTAQKSEEEKERQMEEMREAMKEKMEKEREREKEPRMRGDGMPVGSPPPHTL